MQTFNYENRHEVISHEAGWYISYQPFTDVEPSLLQVLAPLVGEPVCVEPETALMNGDMQLILRGDFRREYEAAFPDLDACIRVFDSNPQAQSGWSVDPRGRCAG